MLETNNEYKAITALEKTIREADKTRTSLESLKQKKEKLENVTMNPEHKFFPYGDALNRLEADGKKRTLAKTLAHALYILIPYGLLFALPIIVIFVLDHYGFVDSARFFSYPSYLSFFAAIYAAVLVLTVLTIFKYSRSVWKSQTKRRLRRLRASRHGILTETLSESEQQIETLQNILYSRIEALEKDISEMEETLQKTHQKIEDNTMVPKKYIPDISIILDYFEDNRVQNIKDAINLLVAERRQDRMFQSLQATLNTHTEELTAVKTVMQSIESLEAKISERPVQAEMSYDDDETRVLDAKLKVARTKKERKKLEKKKRKLEKKQQKD